MQLTLNIMNLTTGNISQEDWTVDQAKAPYELKDEINAQLLLQNKIVISDSSGLLPC